MANDFVRLPDEGEDDGVWADFADPNIRASILGRYTARLYNDAGVLKISKGRIGTDDGTNEGVARIDTITTINMAAVSNSNWAKIEMSIVGAAVTFAAADIVGATIDNELPSGFISSYDPEKGGHYIIATKRVVGLVWKNTGGTLEGVINCIGGEDSFTGYNISDDADDHYFIFNRFKGKNQYHGTIRTSAGTTTRGDVYDWLSPSLENTGDKIGISCSAYNTAGAAEDAYIYTTAIRTAGDTITLYGTYINASAGTVSNGVVACVDGSAVLFPAVPGSGNIELNW